MIIYNNNEWGPEVTIEKEETKTYEELMKDIHSRIVKALNSGDKNAEIIHKNE